MADFVGGAASSLLGVIRSEARLLGRVRHDVQFIQEEMESMNTFLEHLPRRAPGSGSGERDEQIRTWMNQVRRLAQESNNCIDLYLYRCNPEIHFARSGLRRYILWIPWVAQKMVAQHRTAIQLSALRDRVRDIGERRLRYGVKVPAKVAAAGQSHAALLEHTAASSAASLNDMMQEDSEDELTVGMTASGHYGQSRGGALFEHRTPEDNVRLKLEDWIKLAAAAKRNITRARGDNSVVPSVAIVAPDKEETRAIAEEALALGGKNGMRGVLVDIPAVHFFPHLLGCQDILYYILLELQPAKSQPQQQEGRQMSGEEEEEQDALDDRKKTILTEKLKLVGDIMKNIQEMNVDENFSQLKNTVKQMKYGKQLLLQEYSAKEEPLDVLLLALLCLLKPKPADYVLEGQKMKEATRSHADVIKVTAERLKEYVEAHSNLILLEEAHYEHILREVFPAVTTLQEKNLMLRASSAVIPTRTIILAAEDKFKQMMHNNVLVLQELQEAEKSVNKIDAADGNKPAAGENASVLIPDALIEETMKKIRQIQCKIKEHLKIKAIMEKINDCLGRGQLHHHQILLILKLDEDYASGWEQTTSALSLLGCIGGVLMLTTTVNNQRAREYCYPPRQPMDYSLLGLYRDALLDHANQQMDKGRQQICLDILDKCKEHEFCMKIFVHSLYANPKRSTQELSKLYRTLQEVSENYSFHGIAKKMFKFSYSDLPKEYKSCLLYLAIFPKQQSIRRSTLIGRWVVEGLLNKDDWASSVRHANRCFEELVNRSLVYPLDIGSTGKVKSCEIGDLVHGFITKIARKQHIVETQLSHHLARHFSIFNNIRLRRSDDIGRFLHKLHGQSIRVSIIKVLDLEGCQCFGSNNQRYLKDICNKMLLLKYLGLRGTDVTRLPSEINYLLDLEVLDIRETSVSESSTLKLTLLKLKLLLAGHVVPGPGSSKELSSVKLPEKIEKMINLEVLSNVKAQNSMDLKQIGWLWNLRKLGVVIEDKQIYLKNLLRVISDLRYCLRSLSITIPVMDEAPSNEGFEIALPAWLMHSPKLLESLSIRGTTQKVRLLRLLTGDNDLPRLAKVTLTRTWLKKDDLKFLAKLPMLSCIRLRDKAYIDNEITFNKEEFEHLNSFLVEGSNMTVVSFGVGTAPKLEKMILCSTDSIQSLVGVENLPELKEVELKNCNKISLFDKAKKISKVTLSHTILRQDDVNILANMPNMRSLVLKDTSYVEGQLIFNKDEFPRLNFLIVEFCTIKNICFIGGSAPKLEKIIWSFSKDMVSTLSGIDNIPKLKELELNGDFVPKEIQESIMKDKLHIVHNKPENQDQEMGEMS
uniref:Uncharacterized protein n=1 Tax=Avena sativa TaxID=4498 RepID=A0ACD5ZRA7_AVESA